MMQHKLCSSLKCEKHCSLKHDPSNTFQLHLTDLFIVPCHRGQYYRDTLVPYCFDK